MPDNREVNCLGETLINYYPSGACCARAVSSRAGRGTEKLALGELKIILMACEAMPCPAGRE